MAGDPRGLALAAFAAGGGLVLLAAWRRSARRGRVLGRLAAGDERPEPEAPPADDRPFVAARPWLAVVVAGAAFTGVRFGAGLSDIYAAAAALIAALGANELDRARLARTRARIEAQLADAIDLMVGALQAGASVPAALEGAVRESRPPLKAQLAEVTGRIRLGGDPVEALRGLARRVPLENFVLFTSALAVHWEVGGSLAGTLAAVGRAIRDRTELSRRVHSLTAQARASVAGVLLATYFIAAIVWRNDPARMESFLGTQIGSYMVGFMVVMQAVGVAVTTAMTRLKF